MNTLKHIATIFIFVMFHAIVYGQNFNMDGSAINNCTGFFHDSGGAGAGYGLNENFTTTICSDGIGASHIRLLFPGIDIGAGEVFRVYDSNIVDEAFVFDLGFLLTPDEAFIIQATAANPSGCLTIVFQSDGIDEGNTGWDAAIDCIRDCQTIEAVLENTLPAVTPIDTGWIDVCVGTEVFFEGTGNYPQSTTEDPQSDLLSTFEWNFGDGNNGTDTITSHIYEEAGGYTVQLIITDQHGCKSTNFINQRIRVSGPPTYEIDDMLDFTICLNDTINISSSTDTLSNADLIAVPNTQEFMPGNVVVDTVFLPDGVGISYESSVFFTQFPPGAVLENPADLLGITLDLEHSYFGDLDIEIICPDGTSIHLLDDANTNERGSTNMGEPWASDDIDQVSQDSTKGCGYFYTFVNSSPNGTLADVVGTLARTTLTTKASEITGDIHQYDDWTFPAGEYQSDTPFSSLLGCPLNGQWTIRVTDNIARDNGWLFGWQIDFADHLFGDFEQFSPEIVNFDWYDHPSVFNHSPFGLNASPANAGQVAYTFWTEDLFGCQYDTTLIFDVLPANHVDCINCTIEINQEEDLLLCQGDQQQIDVSPAGTLEECVTFQQIPQYAFGAANHPIAEPYSSVLNINSIQPDTIGPSFMEICSVCVDISTDELSDIRLVLEAPNGAQTVLVAMQGGNSDLGFVNTCFTPTSFTPITAGVPPYSGDFRPQGDWVAFNGSPINGNWTLWVSDCCDLTQEGELLQWSIAFNNVNEYTYSWENNSDLSCLDCDNPIATAAISNAYHLSVTDSYGCTAEDTINMQIVEELEQPLVVCNAENNGILFEWSTASVLDSFEYRLTINGVVQNWVGPVQDGSVFMDNFSHNDTVSMEVRIFVPDQNLNCNIPTGSSECIAFICNLTVDEATTIDASCFNVADGSITINVTGGTMPYTYRISGNNTDFTTPTINDLAAGDYTYTVINGEGCDLQEPFTIGSPDSLFVDIDQAFAACFGVDENTAIATGGGGAGTAYSYTWSNGGMGAMQNNLGTNTYQVTVVDADQCEAVNSVMVSSLDSIMFNFLANRPSCHGLNDGGVGINQIMGGAGQTDEDYQLVWEDGSTDIVRVGLSGNTTYCVTVTDTQGCSAEQCRLLPEPEGVLFDLDPQSPTCHGDQDGSISIVPSLDPALFDIQWGANTGNQTTLVATGLAAGFYAVTVTDSDNCTATKDTFLMNPEILDIAFDVVDNDCYNYSQGSIAPIPTGGVPPYHFNWNTGNTDSLLTQLSAGVFSLVLLDDNGCRLEQSTTVDEPAEATIDAVVTDAICHGDHNGSLEITLNGGTPPYMYSLNSSAFTTNPFIIGLGAGNYVIEVKDHNDCSYFHTAELNEPADFTVDAGDDIHILFGDSITLTTIVENEQGVVQYFWSELYPGTLSCLACPEPVASPDFTTDYSVLAIDSSGCEAEDALRVFVDKNYMVAVPTGFTPNNDGTNDLLLVHGTPNVQILSFQVFDRWGEEVFFSNNFDVNDPNIGWDGTFRNTPMNAGVFVWQMEALYPDGNKKLFSGQTMLIR